MKKKSFNFQPNAVLLFVTVPESNPTSDTDTVKFRADDLSNFLNDKFGGTTKLSHGFGQWSNPADSTLHSESINLIFSIVFKESIGDFFIWENKIKNALDEYRKKWQQLVLIPFIIPTRAHWLEG